jgi:hypothetical protein
MNSERKLMKATSSEQEPESAETGDGRRRWKRPTFALAVVGGCIATATGGAVLSASISSSASPATTTIVTAPAGSPAPMQPIDPNALPAQVNQSFPSSPPSGATTISKAQAAAIALRIGDTPSGATAGSGAPASAPTWSTETTYGAVNQQATGNGNYLVSPTTPVWVVTVNSPMTTDGGPGTPGSIKAYYTVVLDAVNGRAIDTCIGCSTLAPAGTQPTSQG